jgi:choline dehydrogenase-like flavoprotein
MLDKHICVVGSGIGSGSLLKKIIGHFSHVTIIEAGKKNSNSNVQEQMIGRNFGIRSTRSIQVGGTSNLWHGVLAPLDEDDFEKKDHIKDSGWPISLKELTPFYQQAGKILGIKDFDIFDVDTWTPCLKRHTKDIIFNTTILRNKIFQQPLPVYCFRNDIFSFSKRKDVTLFQGNPALELLYKDEKVYAIKIGGKEDITVIHADIFVIGAGALETPRLLLNSRIKNTNIGKYLADHPMGNVCQVEFFNPKKAPLYSDMKFSKLLKIKSGLVLYKNYRKKHKLLNHNFFLRPSFVKGIDNKTEELKLSLLSFKDGKTTLDDIWNLIININAIFQIFTYKMSLNVTYRYADLFFVCEQTPNSKSKVTLSSLQDEWGYPMAKVDWRVSKSDINNMHRWIKLLQNDFFSDGECTITTNIGQLDWESVYTSAAHHTGTARMSFDSKTGVVDGNLKVFGFDNLYICDGSVFPTSGNVNSSFTISALACRLADHLKKIKKI